MLVDTHNGAGVVKPGAVVEYRKHRHQLTICEEFETIHNNLVPSAYQMHVVLVEELVYNLGTERQATRSSAALFPGLRILVWIGPEQIVNKLPVDYVCRAHDVSDLVHALQIRAQSSMAAKDLATDNSSNG